MRRPKRIQHVRNRLGSPLLCCWDDCENPGNYRIRIRRPDQTAKADLIYIFCSEVHRAYYRNAHRSYGNIDTAPKMTRSPLGLIVPA